MLWHGFTNILSLWADISRTFYKESEEKLKVQELNLTISAGSREENLTICENIKQVLKEGQA